MSTVFVVAPRIYKNNKAMAMTDKVFNSQFKVLVVDDNVDAADVTHMMLTAIGFQATSCHSGQQALSIAGQQTFNVILMDLDMPEMDGYTVCRNVRMTQWGASLPIIAFTGHDISAFRANPSASCFDGLLSKPASIKDLEASLLDAVSKVNTR